jgi:NAD(P) transhydrogenase subunit beta
VPWRASNPETSRRGNLYGIIGMTIAVLATIFGPQVTTAGLPYIVGAMVIGAGVGLYAARVVKMTQMPELVALMHSLVGLAAMLVGYANFVDPAVSVGMTPAERVIHEIEMYLGVLIGAVTFSGSVIAFGKLSRASPASPCSCRPALAQPRRAPRRRLLRLSVHPRGKRRRGDDADDRDDGDRAPVRRAHGDGDRRRRHAGRRVDAEQLLGWAAAATGFMLSNDLLIVTGALVGSSGAILSYIMCRAMNRNFLSVIAGGFGTDSSAPPPRRARCSLRAK